MSELTNKERISLKISFEDHHNGIHVWFGGPGVVPLPQVRFKSRGSEEFIYIRVVDLEDPEFKIPKNADTVDIAILANSNEIKQRAIVALMAKGIKFQETYEEGVGDRGGEIQEIEITTAIDDIVFRAIAKICFNYLAYTADYEFVLSTEFNEIREFIRYGTRPMQPLVSIDQNPILHHDTSNMRQTNGHLMVLDWDPRRNFIISRLSLFNSATYQIILSRNVSRLVYRDIRSGHHFNIHTMTIDQLAAYRAR